MINFTIYVYLIYMVVDEEEKQAQTPNFIHDTNIHLRDFDAEKVQKQPQQINDLGDIRMIGKQVESEHEEDPDLAM